MSAECPCLPEWEGKRESGERYCRVCRKPIYETDIGQGPNQVDKFDGFRPIDSGSGKSLKWRKL